MGLLNTLQEIVDKETELEEYNGNGTTVKSVAEGAKMNPAFVIDDEISSRETSCEREVA